MTPRQTCPERASRRGTEGSNPASSSGESGANRNWPRRNFPQLRGSSPGAVLHRGTEGSNPPPSRGGASPGLAPSRTLPARRSGMTALGHFRLCRPSAARQVNLNKRTPTPRTRASRPGDPSSAGRVTTSYLRLAQLTLSAPLRGEQPPADRAVSAEQFHARIRPNNATTLSGMDWLRSAKRA
jgi:hypothetical protein